ncbi:MAG: aldo/keto reductase [SAR202 cluster bacterium]|nr:aldo/keto reductase [SAR202 cluster bacterium]
MERKQLGRTGVQVPEVGLGTWKYRGDPAVIHRAIDVGAVLIDTAEMYATEGYVGKTIEGRRDRCFIATKVSPSNLRYRDVLKAADGSLTRLGIDTIDLYQVHWPNSSVPIGETMRAMEELANAGKARFIGVSNFSVAELEDAQRALGGRHRIVSNQVKYSLLDREIEAELLPYCEQAGVTIIGYSPLEQGRFDDIVRRRPGAKEAVDRVARETGKTVAQVLLNWAVYHPHAITIPATNRVERVDENAGASGWRLTAAQHQALRDAVG